MLRGSLSMLVLVAFALSVVAADDPVNKARAKAALALRTEVASLVSAKVMAVPMARDSACDGTCCSDLGAKITKHLAEKDPRPIVIWVGCTPTPATAKALSGYAHVRVESYDADGKGKEQRVLVSLAKAGEYLRAATLPVTAKPEDVKAAVKKGLP